ncbi:MAG: hypothetical protein KDB80_03285 [Planctomycetes bacterium]|nr:hypothetical protein [Planctomycetota bacterium]
MNQRVLGPLFAMLFGISALPAQQLTSVVELGRLPALSQGRAGTCWSFATTSITS